MARVFVAGALLPTGGAYMAYHLGRLLHLYFGYELFDIGILPVKRPMFTYDIPAQTVTVSQMEAMIGPDDLIVLSPVFSHFLFGLRLPGRKIMYVQGFQTFALMDCHCDLYVSVSATVQRYLNAVYGMATPVIPAFIQLQRMPPARPWHERPPGSALVYTKQVSPLQRVLMDELGQKLKTLAPEADLSDVLTSPGLTHGEFMNRLGGVRYFVNLSLAEGFGLVPLEAMAMGALVTGVDGLGGGDYLRPRENCLTGSVRDLRTLPEVVAEAFTDEELAGACAAQGRETAQRYGHKPFKAAWLEQFSQFLNVPPRQPPHAQ